MRAYLRPITTTDEFRELRQAIDRGIPQLMIYGLAGSQKTVFLSALLEIAPSPFVIITHNKQQAERIIEDLSSLMPGTATALFPALEGLAFDTLARSREMATVRLQVLSDLMAGRLQGVVAPVEALLSYLPPASALKQLSLSLEVGGEVDREGLLGTMVAQGYERVPMVEGSGQFSVRGGIIDIFPLTDQQPLRIELFDDEIDSIRRFDLATQRSLDKLPRALVFPARELVLTEEAMERGIKAMVKDLQLTRSRVASIADQEAVKRLEQTVGQIATKVREAGSLDGLERYLPFFYPQPLTLLDYCPTNAMVFLDEPGRIKEVVDFHHQEAMQHQVTMLKGGLALLGQERAILDFGALWQRMEKRRTVSASLLPKRPAFMRSPYAISTVTKSIPAFFGQVKLFAQEVERWHANHFTVVILTATEERGRRVQHMLSEYGVESVIRPELNASPIPGEVVITIGSLETGFEWPQARLIVLTDEEVFGKPMKKRRQRVSAGGLRISSHRELSVGDLVVHINHGIGRYLGVTTLEVGGVHRDYLHIRYAGEDKLYVPTDQVGLVQKYVGAGSEEKDPKLHTLGGADWNRVKTRVQESVREMAEDLVKLYAARQATPGYAFSPDSPWQGEFEDMFSYEETPDQLQSISEVKADMELSRPMDRLLCGDVGYGKTEVAIRAAFKAVMDGKQVAVLVPTTILAQQHYNTFRERFGGFPINVALMSRFRSVKENKETAVRLIDKKVDVVIGTHRLLAKDVKFADLGLLVIDEEQRFGVAHKEKIKQIKTNVDVLTLSATPIPRTLHMAMIGIRDLSVIETPPEDRFPVQTYVVEWNDEMVKEAILRELDRQGQVFLVHNKVQNIDYIAQQIGELVPEARIAVAHGQMPETKLEQIMLEFLDGEYDILLATTIIESGLDMPNVNTIILNDADKFGLSQLYQLRGRVGRSNRLAYAYFTYRRDKQLSEVAEKRLSAIKEFTELGAGYKIALRDLEIRGVGNLLGPQQHGHVAAVGFELYSQLLEEAIAEFKGQPTLPKADMTVELNVEAYIPSNYISDATQKIEFYKRINEIDSLDDIGDVEEEMEDRFGDLALPVRHLLAVARIKLLARTARVTTISQQNGLVALKLHHGSVYHPLLISTLVREFRGALDYHEGKQQPFILRAAGLTDAALLALVEKLLTRLAVVVK